MNPARAETTMYQLCFYVPESHLEKVKNAVFEAGAGRVGSYDRCAWQTAGTGQFRPLPGSEPFSGETGDLSQAPEHKVEMVCAAECLERAVDALLESHPYETPAWSAWPLAQPAAVERT